MNLGSHKTADKYGSAVLVIPPILHEMLLHFVKCLRKLLPYVNADRQVVFCKPNSELIKSLSGLVQQESKKVSFEIKYAANGFSYMYYKENEL